MEPEGSLPCSEDLTTGPCLEQDEYSAVHTLKRYLLKIHHVIIFPSAPRSLE
jgi:hypothetical protein